ncbi:MAG TPA: NAD(P)-binding domain-containing protein [Steroidobacteraceae bacterium]|nr:NAD(P)-binding domain-containing protein [Steroidobacteraceae bacterium]
MNQRRLVLTALTSLGASAALAALPKRVRAQQSGTSSGTKTARETIAVLGTGHFGGAMGKRLSALGYPVVYGSRTPQAARVRALVSDSGAHASAAPQGDAALRATIIVFALPWESLSSSLTGLGDMTGKLLVDPMIAKPKVVEDNPFPPDAATSTAEQLQLWAPGAQVVKAFPTITYKTLAKPASAGGPISVPFAGASPSAKDRVALLISELGFDPVDTGPLVAARYIENLLWFEVACNRYNKKSFELYMRNAAA